MTTIKNVTIYSDASGAPATIVSGRFTYAMDLTGELRTTLIGGPQSGPIREERKRALVAAEGAYRREVVAKLDAAWLAANRTMYA